MYRIISFAVLVALVAPGSNARAQATLIWTSFTWQRTDSLAGWCIARDPRTTSTFYASAGGKLVRSTDAGYSWTILSSAAQSRCLLVHPSDGSIFLDQLLVDSLTMSTTAGLYKSTDGGASFRMVLSDVEYDGESLVIDPQHPDTMYTADFAGDVFESTDRGETWEVVGTAGEFCTLTVRPDSTSILYGGTGEGSISKSTDRGRTWRLVYQAKDPGAEVPKIVFSIRNPQVGYATFYESDLVKILKSTNGGETWAQLPLDVGNPWALDINQLHPDTLYVGSFGGKFGPGTLHRSYDGGATWTEVRAGLPSSLDVWMLRVLPADSEVVLFASTVGMFRNVEDTGYFISTPEIKIEARHGGLSHASISIHNSSSRVLRIDSVSASLSYVSALRLPLSLPANATDSIDFTVAMPFDSPPGPISASVVLYSVSFAAPVPISLTINPPELIPQSFSLEQNFPNPFNSSTSIQFNLARESDISLEVYDLRGRRVATLLEGTKSAGLYAIQWNADRLASGLYICRLATPVFTASRKMLLVK